VLIIDDDPLFLKSLGAYLEDGGYQVLKAKDGDEGVELFSARRPEVVVTDLRMPGRDGIAVLKAVRELSPETPLIVLTGTEERRMTEKLVEQGAWCCLYKPLYHLRELVMAIEMALAGKSEESR
jgi:DNA-binding response OmpR family regulator